MHIFDIFCAFESEVRLYTKLRKLEATKIFKSGVVKIFSGCTGKKNLRWDIKSNFGGWQKKIGDGVAKQFGEHGAKKFQG